MGDWNPSLTTSIRIASNCTSGTGDKTASPRWCWCTADSITPAIGTGWRVPCASTSMFTPSICAATATAPGRRARCTAFAEYILDLSALADVIGNFPIYLVGHSLGGVITLALFRHLSRSRPASRGHRRLGTPGVASRSQPYSGTDPNLDGRHPPNRAPRTARLSQPRRRGHPHAGEPIRI